MTRSPWIVCFCLAVAGQGPAAIAVAVPPLPKAGDGGRSGRLNFRPVKLNYIGSDGRAIGSRPDWRASGGGIAIPEGLVKCAPGVDVLWGKPVISVMKEKGHVVEVFRDKLAQISDVCWDGKWLWAATRTDRIPLREISSPMPCA